MFLFEIQKYLYEKFLPLLTILKRFQAALKFRTWCFLQTLYTEYKAIQALDT